MYKLFIICFLTIYGLSSCGGEQPKPITTPQEEEEPHLGAMVGIDPPKESLASQLGEQKASFDNRTSKEIKTIYNKGIEAVANTGITKSALQVGDKAFDFELRNAVGEPVTLSSYLDKGYVVLTWYRGGWCPYCNITLNYLQEELPRFQELGANLIALTPELPDKSMTTKEKNNLSFEVLSDINNRVGKQYGVVFKLNSEVADIYEKSFGLSAYNGNDLNELPLAATYLIDSEGIVQYAFLHADYRKRAEPSAIIDMLKTLREEERMAAQRDTAN
jgi:peroxiredoxin